MTSLKLALDWSPNTIHSGLLLAQELGYFTQAGLDVEIISTEADNYAVYPITKLQEGLVDIAMAPSEHLFHHHVAHPGSSLRALATVFQQDRSAYIYHRSSGITRAADLDGKTFGCYGTFLETELLKSVIVRDGGRGQFETFTPGKLQLWSLFLEKKIDACWVFTTWEYADALHRGLDVGLISLQESGVPYGPSPILMVDAARWEGREEVLHVFRHAAEKGYQYLSQQTEAATERLCQAWAQHPNWQNPAFIAQSHALCLLGLLDANGRWGRIDPTRFRRYWDWLLAQGLVGTPLEVEALIWG